MYFLNHFMLTLKHSLILLTLTLATDNGLRIPIRGYEDALNRLAGLPEALRIPIRGYEAFGAVTIVPAVVVTNPYKGL